ncbi:Interleukin-17 receptor B [Myotis davidii]|uniref:Interleukin-17 receptor B n=1 Tax=Myotis davidii TaxID=225400 RepID=L5MEI8_MYODS|nr:Interleukin-17 receptor B [Myotis davidii]
MSLVLLSLAALCQGAQPPEPTIQCGSENGPSPEWMVSHTLTPGDLRDLRVEPVVTKSSSILMNISWILRADASIRFLKATKICVSGKSHVQSYSCVRCNYTEAFQTQTRPSGGKSKLTHVSVMVPVTQESEGAVVQLTPYFRTCGNDCIRRKGTVVLCPQTDMSFPLDNSRSVLSGWLPLLLLVPLAATGMLAAGTCLMWRHERIKTSFPTTTLLPPIKVLVVYPPEICFHHTVCYFTEFLQNHCRSEVILDKWQRKKIAEMGPVQWLTAQKKAAEKVIFLLSNDVNTVCDGTCGKSNGSPGENSQDLFPLAFNLFCSDLRSQTHLHKYMVVYFREADIKDDYNALNVCPKYRLMKDSGAFCTELLHAEQHVWVGKRLRACHSCSSV